jgi:hypothetical protein
MANIYAYYVTYHLCGYPTRKSVTIVNAPSIKYIKEHWSAICGGRPYVLSSISKIKPTPSARHSHRYM